MTTEFENNKLEINARRHEYDAQLDPIADAMDRGDAADWQSLPVALIDKASFYRDYRTQYRAVSAGAIPDDRSGPSAA